MTSNNADDVSLETLSTRAREWMRLDPNPTTESHVASLLHDVDHDRGDDDDDDTSSASSSSRRRLLDTYFGRKGRMGFGTAGLRGPMMPGPHGMNDLVVVQTTQGLARYCLDHRHNNEPRSTGTSSAAGKPPKAVVGYDHRRSVSSLDLSSLRFALLTKLVFERAGISTILLRNFVPTPLVAFSTKFLEDCIVGVMITASHNPKNDDGYKVYWGDGGCQIRPPMDTDISRCISENLDPWVDYRSLLAETLAAGRGRLERGVVGGGIDERGKEEEGEGKAEDEDEAVLLDALSDGEETRRLTDEYYAAVSRSGLIVTIPTPTAANSVPTGGGPSSSSSEPPPGKERRPPPPRIAYTAMHGVGHPFASRMFETFNLPPFHSVPSQQMPDPNFSTVSFPNPEEKGALDEAMTFAEGRGGCDVMLANDPDADRLAVAEYDRTKGRWRVFTGDQIGTMLGMWLWEKRIGRRPSGKKVAMCVSTVSSKMLAAIGRVEGFRVEETLTGFKWIASRAISLREEEEEGGYDVIFGYEEAIGFMCGDDVVNDKDGLVASAVMAELITDLYRSSSGSTLSGHMQSLYDRYGEFVSNNGYYICHDPTTALRIFDRIRNGGEYVRTVGGYDVKAIRDLGSPGYDSTKTDRRPTLPTSSSSPMISITFVNGCVAQFRASGTEPKFKYYIELPGKAGVTREVVEEELRRMSEVILEELLQPSKHGLTKSKL